MSFVVLAWTLLGPLLHVPPREELVSPTEAHVPPKEACVSPREAYVPPRMAPTHYIVICCDNCNYEICVTKLQLQICGTQITIIHFWDAFTKNNCAMRHSHKI